MQIKSIPYCSLNLEDKLLSGIAVEFGVLAVFMMFLQKGLL